MEEQKKKTQKKSDFENQKKFIKQLAFELDLEGSKSFMVLEKGEESCVLNSGLSGKSIVKLVMCLAIEHESFFLYALELLKEFEDGMKDTKHTSIN